MICKILLHPETCVELWTVDTADFDWNVIDRDLFKQIVTKQIFFWLYNILWKEVMCKRYLPLKRQIIPVKIIIWLHFHVSGKNRTDSTVFHFLVKSNFGKLEIAEEIESFWGFSYIYVPQYYEAAWTRMQISPY